MKIYDPYNKKFPKNQEEATSLRINSSNGNAWVFPKLTNTPPKSSNTNFPEEKQGDVSLRFNYPEMENNKKFQDLAMKEEISYEDTQEVELVIYY